MSRKNSRRRSAHNYQTLESRQMLASITALETGEVRVVGDDTADVIRLIGSSDFQSFTVSINNDPNLTESFAYSDVANVTVFANGGNDVVANTLLLDTFVYGGDGDDLLQGGFLNDLLSGGDGNDILNSRNGDDVLNGGAGNDRLAAFNGNDRLFGFDGEDRLFGGNGDDVIVGGAGDDFVRGDAGDDAINGNDGDDIINAGLGDDTVNGGLGIDQILGIGGLNTLNGNGDDDTIFGGTDADQIDGGSGDDRLVGREGDDFIIGSGGADVIFGGADNDTLGGGSGDDFLSGQDGDDSLFGQEGEDTQFGNDGNDTFFFPSNNERINGGAGVDLLRLAGTTRSEFRLDRVGSDIRFTDLRNPDSLFYLGQLTLTSIEQLRSTGQDPQPVESFLFAEADRRITVQPIIAADNDGSNAASGFGTAEQEAEIKRRIDQIFKQAGIDVEFLPAKQINNTFINGSGDGDRPREDFGQIFTAGDAAGVGSSDPTVIDLYFVSRTPGFDEPGPADFTGGGRAFLGGSGITVSVKDTTTSRESGRGEVARLIAHEIGHNLGLGHTAEPSLLSLRFPTETLLQSQTNVARQSNLTRSINGNDSSAIASGAVTGDSTAASAGFDAGHVHFHGDGHDHTVDTGETGDSGGCDCGVCGLCTGVNIAE